MLQWMNYTNAKIFYLQYICLVDTAYFKYENRVMECQWNSFSKKGHWYNNSRTWSRHRMLSGDKNYKLVCHCSLSQDLVWFTRLFHLWRLIGLPMWQEDTSMVMPLCLTGTFNRKDKKNKKHLISSLLENSYNRVRCFIPMLRVRLSLSKYQPWFGGSLITF